MRIVANIQVGNEVELIDEHIAYHAALGVDRFVIVDMFSDDGTSERLERYRDHPCFEIKRVLRHEVVNDSGIHTQELSRWMLEVARDQFQADWILRIDADEFLYPIRGDLRASLAGMTYGDAFSIPRYNAVFRRHDRVPPAPTTHSGLGQFSVVAKPIALSAGQDPDDADTPFILTKVGPKIIARAQTLAGFTRGTHSGLDAEGNDLTSHAAPGMVMVHFWFTTYARFARKAQNTADFETEMRRHLAAGVGWQWSHWAKIVGEGDTAIKNEYARQFLARQQYDALRDAGVIQRVDQMRYF